MSSSNIEDSDYWVSFWNQNQIVDNHDLQQQIGRTINKEPISQENWSRTVSKIIEICELNNTDDVADLCSGNGLLSIPFAKICKSVTAVDVSKKLLSRIDTEKYENIKKLECDLRLAEFDSQSFSKVIIYFAIQHFNERETIALFQSVYKWLKPNGMFYIGDIPDQNRIWNFFHSDKFKSDYFKSIEQSNPILGHWFSKEFITHLGEYIGFKQIEVIPQEEFMINNYYRFDVLLKK